jgi:hypothetical protein
LVLSEWYEVAAQGGLPAYKDATLQLVPTHAIPRGMPQRGKALPHSRLLPSTLQCVARTAARVRTATFADVPVRLKPEVILATATIATKALQAVFVLVSDPVGDGLVASLAKPGATGFTTFEFSLASK